MALDADTDKGTRVLTYFHNYNVANFPDVYKYDFTTLVNTITAMPSGSAFLEGFGLAVNSIPLDDEQSQKAMEAFAEKSQGRLPANWQSFFKALSDQAQDISWIDLTKNTAVGVAGQVLDGLTEAGNVAIDTLKGLGSVLPFLMVGGLVFYVWNKVKK